MLFQLKTRAYYSTLRIVYHTRDDCVEGRKILKKYLKQGKGGRSLCAACKALTHRRDSRSIYDAIDRP